MFNSVRAKKKLRGRWQNILWKHWNIVMLKHLDYANPFINFVLPPSITALHLCTTSHTGEKWVNIWTLLVICVVLAWEDVLAWCLTYLMITFLHPHITFCITHSTLLIYVAVIDTIWQGYFYVPYLPEYKAGFFFLIHWKIVGPWSRFESASYTMDTGSLSRG